eukprot:364470-Chlamydomonas_euryale.AAC.2
MLTGRLMHLQAWHSLHAFVPSTTLRQLDRCLARCYHPHRHMQTVACSTAAYFTFEIHKVFVAEELQNCNHAICMCHWQHLLKPQPPIALVGTLSHTGAMLTSSLDQARTTEWPWYLR